MEGSILRQSPEILQVGHSALDPQWRGLPERVRRQETASQGPTLPLQAIRHQLLPDAASVYQHLNQAGQIKSFRPNGPDCYQYAGDMQLNGLTLLSYTGSAAQFLVKPSTVLSLVATFSGAFTVKDPMGTVCAKADQALLVPIGVGEREYSSTASAAGAALFMEPEAVSRVAAAMAGLDPASAASAKRCGLFQPTALSPSEARSVFALLRYVDDCATTDPLLPIRLGLDDVILRVVACLRHPEVLADSSAEPACSLREHRRSAFDELIDYIRANLDQPLRLSDLEARSFYSRRALQYAFREKLGTTPVQWIREQRLSMAMEQLQNQSVRTSIRAVALACGYRQTSQFSADFKRRFGLSPSQVRRPSLC